jgi:hypothetical protein
MSRNGADVWLRTSVFGKGAFRNDEYRRRQQAPQVVVTQFKVTAGLRLGELLRLSSVLL